MYVSSAHPANNQQAAHFEVVYFKRTYALLDSGANQKHNFQDTTIFSPIKIAANPWVPFNA